MSRDGSRRPSTLAPLEKSSNQSLGSTSLRQGGKKTRTLIIRRSALEEPKQKVKLVVARKPRPGEELSNRVPSKEPPRPKGIRRDATGKPLSRSILGSVELFQEVEAEENPWAGFPEETVDPAQDSETSKDAQTPDAPQARASTNDRAKTPKPGELEKQKYLGKVRAGIAKAEKARLEEAEAERAHLDVLKPYERLGQGRDGKVMAKWQERQTDWERLQRTIAGKTGKDPDRVLMAESNDYRERQEEYSTILASEPVWERYKSAYWEFSLRNGGSRLIPVGNIFSGLFCPLRAELPVPKVVRRPGLPPRPEGDWHEEGITKTWRDDEALSDKKRHLRKYLKTVRPHEITQAMSNSLVVVGQDLLRWAHDSSKEHFAAAERAKRISKGGLPPDTEDAEMDDQAGPEGEVAAGHSVTSVSEDSGLAVRGPRILLGPSPYVLLEAGVKEPVEGALTLQNLGSTTLFYEWHRLEDESPSLVALSKRKTAEGTCASDPCARFAISQDATDSRFLCQNASGVLMPGQTKATVFAFESATPGSFSETWTLRVSPPAMVLGDLIPSDEGLVAVSLLGAATTIDTNEHRRDPMRRGIEKKVTRADLEQMVTEVVREVRTPVREAAVRQAQRANFEARNVGLNYTAPIYDAFAALWTKTNDLAPKEPDQEDEPLAPWDETVASIREVIDRIYEPEILVLPESSEQSGNGSKSEEGGGGGEEEEEEEEEDSEEEEASEEEEGEKEKAAVLEENSAEGDESVASSKRGKAGEEEDHELEQRFVESVAESVSEEQAAQNDVDLEWKLLVARSLVRPLPLRHPTGMVVGRVLNSLANVVVDAVEAAREEVELAEDETIPPLPPAFDQWYVPVDAPRVDGPALWAESLREEYPDEEPKSREDKYHSSVYHGVYSKMCDLIDGYSLTAGAVHAEALKAYTASIGMDLKTMASLRYEEDARGKRVLLLVDLDVGQDMIPDPFSGDEWGIPENQRLDKIFLVARMVRKLLREEPSTVMITTLLTPPPPEAGDEKHPVPELCDLSIKSLAPMLEAVLRMDVTFCPSVAKLEAILSVPESSRLGQVILLDHVEADPMVPFPEPEPVLESDDEEERLPWLGTEKDDPDLMDPPSLTRLNLGTALVPLVDLFVCDTAEACLDPKLSLSPLSMPTVERVVGPNLHKEVASASVLLNRPKRPFVAIVAGDELLDEVKHIDRMIDVVDELVIAGKIALVFLSVLGHKTGAAKFDPSYEPMAKALLSKAQTMGVPVTLPVDFVMGDVFVDALSEGPKHDEEDQDPDEEQPDESSGFDYDGETMECTVSEGLMRTMHPLDLGNQTINLLKELLERCNTVLWTGLVGVAQCSAFQNGSRELVEAVVQAHEDRNTLVMIGGDELVRWAELFADLDPESGPLGDGNGVTHAFKDLEIGKRLLSMVPAPGLEGMLRREPNEEEELLEEEVQAKRIMGGYVSEDDEDEEMGYDDGGDGAESADY